MTNHIINNSLYYINRWPRILWLHLSINTSAKLYLKYGSILGKPNKNKTYVYRTQYVLSINIHVITVTLTHAVVLILFFVILIADDTEQSERSHLIYLLKELRIPGEVKVCWYYNCIIIFITIIISSSYSYHHHIHIIITTITTITTIIIIYHHIHMAWLERQCCRHGIYRHRKAHRG